MKKHTIINSNDIRDALAGKEVKPRMSKTHKRAAAAAANVCKQLVFVFDVAPEAKYFADITNLQDLKAAYKDLAAKHHPDRGGNTATMAAINAEYDSKVKELAKGAKVNAKTKVAEKTAGMSDEEITEAIAAEFKATIEALQKLILDGVQIELIGSWLWVSGNTKPIKDDLKKIGFRWAPKKEGQPWTWHDSYTYYPRSRRGQKTKEEIEDKYGKEILKSA